MRITFRSLIILAVVALAAVPAFADEMVSLKAGYQLLSPSGTFAVSGSNLAGSSIDLENDLGFDDSKNLTAEAALQFGNLRLAAGYLPIKFSGLGQLDREITFNGQTYAANVQTSSDVDVKLYEGSIGYHVINFDDIPVRLQITPELSVKVLDANLSLTGTESGTSTRIHEEKSATVPFPTLGARVRVGLADYLAVVGRVGYIKYRNDSFLDADGQVEFSPLPLVGVYGGYRYFDTKVDESDINLDAHFSGPYVGAFVRF